MAGLGPAVAQAAAAGPVQPVSDPASLVDPFINTGIGGAGGTVNSFPGPDVPFGMLQWGPDTSPDRQAGGGYYYGDSQISGFSLTHLDGPGCGAFGDVPILPTVGALPSNPSSVTEPFSHKNESASADYYSVQTGTGSAAVTTELTEAAHSALGRFTFPAGTQSDLLFKLSDSQNGDSATSAQVIGNNEVQGSVTTGQFCGASDVYTVYFDITFDQPFTASGTWTGTTTTPNAKSLKASGTTAKASPSVTKPLVDTNRVPAPTYHQTGPASSRKAASSMAAASPDGLYLTFDTSGNQVVQAKVGISFVSAANAKANWQADQPGFDFNGVHAAGVAAWNSELSKIQIGGGPADREQVFYTALYHSLLHPNIFSDVNGQYIGFDNKIHTTQPGHVQVANYSGWDIYRSQAQLEAIVDPTMASDSAQSMVNDAAQNNGMLPKWALANGETDVMVGDPADGILSGYYAFGARNFDTAAALKYALAEANTPGDIRPDLSYYEQLGYVPSDGVNTCCNFYGSVSTTLEYGASDAALSQFAAALGDTTDAQSLMTRSQNWQNLYNPATGYIQPKTVNGMWVPVTSTTQNDYVEGDASQYRWEVGWNEKGLITAMGGNAAVNQQLDTFFTDLNDGPASSYSFWDNQFEYAVPWTYDFTGEPWKAQQVVNRIRTQLYLDNPTGEGDNDDLGATASMGVMTMLGMFPQYTGSAQMVLNSPEFPLEIIHLANGKSITINAPGASSASNYYVQSLKLNGSPWNKSYLPASVFTTGATLDFTVGSKPNADWAAAPQDAPPSYGTGQQSAIGYLSSQQVTVAPGGSTTVKVAAHDAVGKSQQVHISVAAPAGITVTPSDSTFEVPPDGHGALQLTVSAAASSPQTFYTVPIKLWANGTQLPTQTLTVLVAPPGSLLAGFDNAGISDDANPNTANFDTDGYSYSVQTLSAAGFTAGSAVTVGGITYNWPLPAPGYADNAIAAGQKVTVNAPAGTAQLGFLGSATNGPSQGMVTLTYSDGSTSEYWLGLSDWTLGGGSAKPSYGNQIAATLPYRNCQGCTSPDKTTAYLFTASVPVDPSKTLTSVTLPNGTSQGELHVFAVGTSTTAISGAVASSVSPATAGAGQQVTIAGSGFGAAQGTGSVSFTDQGTTWGATGGPAAVTVDSWSDTSITFTVPQASGTGGQWHVYPGTPASVSVVNGSGQTSDSAVLRITPTANLADYYDNAGISPDNNQACANYDGDGYSYSADALAGTGLTPGATVTADGLSFTWPNAAACAPDNILAAGQTMLLQGKAGASQLGLLGSSTNGGTSGTITIAYTDGTSTSQSFTLNDWAVGPGNGDATVSTTSYRNSTSGSSQTLTMYVYATTVPIDASKTVASITFPDISNQVNSSTAAMHVFAVSEG